MEIMGWKSSVGITRAKAIQPIISSIDITHWEDMANEQLGEL